MKRNILLTSVLLAALAGCTATPSSSASQTASANTVQSNTPFTWQDLDAGFDTLFFYFEYNDSKEAAEAHFNEADQLFRHYDRLFDIYDSYEGINNLKTVNDQAGISPVTVDADIIELLEEAKQFYTWSNNEFDVTSGDLLSVWHKYREEGMDLNANGKEGYVPPEDELKEAATHSGWDCVEINDTDNTVYITDPEVSLDVGGIAKGFAVEKIAQSLMKKDDCGVVTINAGGNIRTIGSKPNGKPWSVGIQNPDGTQSASLLAVSKDGSSSFVTSGDYERFYVADNGMRYHHIIDPNTLFPSTLYRSVSIVTEDSSAADCLSTTLFTMRIEDGKKVIAEYEKASGKTVDVIWIMSKDNAQKSDNEKELPEYTVAYTDGLKDAITWAQ